MRISKLSAALAAAVTLSFASLAAADAPDPNRVMIQFKPGSKANVASALRAAGANVHHELDIANAFAATVPPQALQGLMNNPNIELIEPDVARYPMGQVTPYGIPMVQAPDLVATGADGTGIKVCVIDSGIKADHEDFAGISMTGHASSGQSWNTDTCGHGTHVAGTIAAANNGLGVIGVSPGKVSLHIVKVFDGTSCGWSYSSTLVNAAQNCQNAGAKVINMSLGGGTSSSTENTAFSNLNNAGILSIAAAGNAGNTSMSYPASYSSVMSVAAIDSNKALASFSQRNSQVEIAAPGVGVLSTVPFVGATTSVDGLSYIVAKFEGSVSQNVSGSLVSGGLCDSVGSWSGRVVLCERGAIAFNDKARNVQSGGGVGVIIYNNVAGGFSGTLGTSNVATIPAVSMSREDGLFLVGNKLGTSAAVSTVSNSNGSGYEYYDGTSMASPHVAGVAAIVWSAKPTATNTDVRNALNSTAEDLGSAGRDTSFGYGLIRAFAAADALVNGGGTEPPPATAPSSLTGSKTRKGQNYTYGINWSGGGSTIDIYRGTSKIRSAISNSGTYSETLKNVTSATYRVCNAGSTTECSNSLTL